MPVCCLTALPVWGSFKGFATVRWWLVSISEGTVGTVGCRLLFTSTDCLMMHRNNVMLCQSMAHSGGDVTVYTAGGFFVVCIAVGLFAAISAIGYCLRAGLLTCWCVCHVDTCHVMGSWRGGRCKVVFCNRLETFTDQAEEDSSCSKDWLAHSHNRPVLSIAQQSAELSHFLSLRGSFPD